MTSMFFLGEVFFSEACDFLLLRLEPHTFFLNLYYLIPFRIMSLYYVDSKCMHSWWKVQCHVIPIGLSRHKQTVTASSLWKCSSRAVLPPFLFLSTVMWALNTAFRFWRVLRNYSLVNPRSNGPGPGSFTVLIFEVSSGTATVEGRGVDYHQTRDFSSSHIIPSV